MGIQARESREGKGRPGPAWIHPRFGDRPGFPWNSESSSKGTSVSKSLSTKERKRMGVLEAWGAAAGAQATEGLGSSGPHQLGSEQRSPWTSLGSSPVELGPAGASVVGADFTPSIRVQGKDGCV